MTSADDSGAYLFIKVWLGSLALVWGRSRARMTRDEVSVDASRCPDMVHMQASSHDNMSYSNRANLRS